MHLGMQERLARFSSLYQEKPRSFYRDRINEQEPTLPDLIQSYSTMFSQASRLLTQFLQQLQYMFQRNNLKFKVKHLHESLMRMLTPHQLLSHYHIVNNAELFDRPVIGTQTLTQCKYKNLYKKMKRENGYTNNWNSNYQNGKKTGSEPQYFYDMKQMHDNRERCKKEEQQPPIMESKNFLQSQFRPSPVQKAVDNTPKLPKGPSIPASTPQNRGSRPHLPVKIEKHLARWVVERISNGQTVLIKDVARQCKQMVHNNPKFTGSLGWANRFLMRFPKVKHMMKLAKGGDWGSAQAIRDRALTEISEVTSGFARFKVDGEHAHANGHGRKNPEPEHKNPQPIQFGHNQSQQSEIDEMNESNGMMKSINSSDSQELGSKDVFYDEDNEDSRYQSINLSNDSGPNHCFGGQNRLS